MKIKTVNHMVAIEAATASDFQERMEQAFADLEGKDLDITYNTTKGHCAYITYKDDKKVPESLADEYELKGICLTCSDCPELEGRGDKRRRYFSCPVDQMVRPKQGACERLYRKLEKGEIEL